MPKTCAQLQAEIDKLADELDTCQYKLEAAQYVIKLLRCRVRKLEEQVK